MVHYFGFISRSLCVWVGLIVFVGSTLWVGYTLGTQTGSLKSISTPASSEQKVLNLLAEAPVYALPLSLTSVTEGTVVGHVMSGANPRAMNVSQRTVQLSDRTPVMQIILGTNNQPQLVSAARRDLVVGMSVMVIADSDIATTSVITPKEVRILLQ